MRILFFTQESFPTFRADVAALFGRHLPRFGIQSDLVALRAQQAGDDAASWEGGELFARRVNGGATTLRIGAVWHAVLTAWRVEAAHYDAFQVRDMPVVAAIVMLIARWRRQRLYYWMSYPIPEGQISLARERGLSGGWMKFLYPLISGSVGRFLLRHWVLPRADHVFVQSPRMKDEWVAAGLPAERMTPVPMGVDLAALDGMDLTPVSDERLQGRRVIGYLGTTDRPRQIEQLFDMLAQVRSEIPQAVLLIVGDTEDEVHRAWLKQRAAERGVADAVIWTGWLATRKAWELMLNAEVAISAFPRGPLLDSASPTKVPEYLALGLPVVCNDNPDQAAVIAETGAGLCVPYSGPDFARAALALMRLDSSQRASMRAAGRRYVSEHRDYPVLAAALAAKYHGLSKLTRS